MKSKLNATEYQGVLYGELLPFITEWETKRQFFVKTLLLFIQPPLRESGFNILE